MWISLHTCLCHIRDSNDMFATGGVVFMSHYTCAPFGGIRMIQGLLGPLSVKVSGYQVRRSLEM